MSIGTHHGGCACGAVRYTVEIDPAAQAITCNCSHCGRAGLALQFVTPDKFTLDQGGDRCGCAFIVARQEYNPSSAVDGRVFRENAGRQMVERLDQSSAG